LPSPTWGSMGHDFHDEFDGDVRYSQNASQIIKKAPSAVH